MAMSDAEVLINKWAKDFNKTLKIGTQKQDSRLNRIVEIELRDGCRFRYVDAMVIITDKEHSNYYCVFTIKYGYMIFDVYEVLSINQLQKVLLTSM